MFTNVFLTEVAQEFSVRLTLRMSQSMLLRNAEKTEKQRAVIRVPHSSPSFRMITQGVIWPLRTSARTREAAASLRAGKDKKVAKNIACLQKR